MVEDWPWNGDLLRRFREYKMGDLLIKWAAISGALMTAASMMPSVQIRSWGAAFGGAAIFGIANLLLGWLLTLVAKIVLFLPAVVTLGLVYLVVPVGVNMILLKMADRATGDDMVIHGVSALLTLSLAVTVTTGLVNRLL